MLKFYSKSKCTLNKYDVCQQNNHYQWRRKKMYANHITGDTIKVSSNLDVTIMILKCFHLHSLNKVEWMNERMNGNECKFLIN